MRWVQPTRGVPVSASGSEHVAVPQPAMGRPRTVDEDPRDCRGQTALWVPQGLCAVAAGRVTGESQDGRAALSGRRALIVAAGAEEGHGGPSRRAAAAPRARALLCDGLCP